MGRFLNADAFKYLGADGPIHGMNLYAYCGNNPVVNSDPTGCFVSWIVIAAITYFVVDAIVETAVLMNSEEYKAENVYNAEKDSVQIPNSAAFNNPVAHLVYSKYLYENVKRQDGSNYFTGDVYDIVGEWQAHNVAALASGILMLALLPISSMLSYPDAVLKPIYEELHKPSVHVDLGRSIEDEKRSAVRAVSEIYKWYNKITTWNMLNW